MVFAQDGEMNEPGSSEAATLSWSEQQPSNHQGISGVLTCVFVARF
jgi:hypothetical protein